MIAQERGRIFQGAMVALTLTWAVGVSPAFAQAPQTKGRGQAKAASPAPSAEQAPRLQLAALPVNPTDPIAIVNNQVITREQLAHECISRKGEEILETMIARTLIEQALKNAKLEVTASEIDAEIDSVAHRVAGLGREAWLRTLDKERGISPIQYARDIIYPALALRKLASPRVQVTQLDMTRSFEAQYGDKLRCRLIMVDKLASAREIWEELRKNPGGFEKLAMERSMDSGSRSLGGLLAEPISRHAYPETVSDAAFSQLVDGDPKDRNPDHKPKDGDFTGPIQVAENTWILLRREGVMASQRVDPKDEQVKKTVYEMIYEVKLKEAMTKFMSDLLDAAAIDNKLSGRVKMANEAPPSDEKVQLMGGKPAPPPAQPSSAATAPNPTPGAAAQRPKSPPPAALSEDVLKQDATHKAPVAPRTATPPQP